ncbi:MAG: helix-turn-helix domain-containing protein [Conexivisphaerales archaeon]
MDERQTIEYQLRGKTLKVYLYLLKQKREVGVREVQRELGFSSPSVSFHHLEKLVELGLAVKKENGEYELVKSVDVGVLQAFTNIAGFTLPRLSFYAVFFSVIAFSYLALSQNYLDPIALVGCFGSAIGFWYETVRTWRRRPF